MNKHLAALQDFYFWRGLVAPQGVKRHPVPCRARGRSRRWPSSGTCRPLGAWPVARDRATALLPLYAGSRIAEIAALDVPDVHLTAR